MNNNIQKEPGEDGMAVSSSKSARITFKTPVRKEKHQQLVHHVNTNNDNKRKMKKAKDNYVTSARKNKKSSDVSYYKGLENFLLKPSNTMKLQFWSKESSGPGTSVGSNRDDEFVSDNHQQIMDHSSTSNSSSVVVLPGSIDKSSLEFNNSNLSTQKRPSPTKKSVRISSSASSGFKKRSRMKCGSKTCVPCSYDVDCGECLQCLHKKTKKSG